MRRTTVLYRPAEPFARWWQSLSHPLVEKTILTGLIVAIFSQVFAIEATVVQITVACGFIVVVNATVSDWLRRRGTDWRNTLTQFVGLLIINWGALVVYLAFRTRFNADLQAGPTLTMLGLLTLIVILYDRYRTLRLANTGALV